MTNEIKIGVIGAGRWGRNIIKTLYELGALKAVAEQNPELRNQVQSLYPDVEIYESHLELLQQDIPAVAIATPVFTHFDIAKDALNANKDVFVEKPMTVTAEESHKLIELANNKYKVLMVGHMLLYQPAIQFIKQFISANKLGRLYSLRQVRRNLGTIRTAENALYSLGVHDLAVLSFLVGEPVKEVQHTSQAIINENIEGDIALHITYESGTRAHLHVCWLWPIKERQLMILGEKGALHYDELKQTVTYHKRYGNKDATVTDEGSEVVFEGSSQPLLLEMEHFIDCVIHRKTPLSPGSQGAEVVALIEAVANKKEATYA